MYLFIIIFLYFFIKIFIYYSFIFNYSILLFLIIVLYFYFYFIFRVKFATNQIITIGNLQNINYEFKDDLIQYIIERLGISTDAYITNEITSIIISYGIREGKITNTINPTRNKNIPFHTFYSKKLPIGKVPSDYGRVISEENNKYTIINNKIVIIMQVFGLINRIKYYKDGILIISWNDKIVNDKENYIIREIGKSCYHFKNNKLILKKIIKPTSPIKKVRKELKLTNKFITMDLETININGKLYPYLLCWYDGINTKSYYNNINRDDDIIILEEKILRIIKLMVNDICIKQYKGYKIYLHNLSKFDGFFLIKYLAIIGIVDPIIHKGKIISINFNLNSNKITFMDSYLMLPSSLKKLSESFKISNPKGIFPVLFNNVNYIGEVPHIKYFNNLTDKEYNNYKNNFSCLSEATSKGNNSSWNFKMESIKYCELDCISLFQILSKFNQLIFNQFNININKYPTLPSLSFAIFRTHYNKEEKMHMLSGQVYNDIKKSYTGGAVDMYIPKNPNGKKLYAYDVNSLYPYVMNNCKLPIGSPTYFEGDITLTDPDAFGFFNCKITCPDNLKHPIIQTHIKTSDGIRTIAPVGTWNDMLFSEEIKNAKKFGYTFEILSGYTFKSDFVFKDFITDLYQLRTNYDKSDPMNYIAKIIMNSLYGRFGMDDNFTLTTVISKEDYSNFEKLNPNNILDVITLGDNYLLNTKNSQSELNTNLDNGFEVHNINISTASAILLPMRVYEQRTSYARIHMSQFKNNPDYNLYYSDTDSIYIDKELDSSLVNNSILGKMKLEAVIDKAIFIAPKVYGYTTIDNKTIIKVKGLSNESIKSIDLNILEELLSFNKKLTFNNEKWYKDIATATINIKDQIYSLRATGNKRKLIFNEDNILINTEPFKLPL